MLTKHTITLSRGHGSKKNSITRGLCIGDYVYVKNWLSTSQVGKVSTNFAAAKNGKVGSNFSAAKNGQVSSNSKKR